MSGCTMSKGILHLAVTGRVALQLQYREPRTHTQDTEYRRDIAHVDWMSQDNVPLGPTYDLTYMEN
jgi:hypothetical protein